MYIAVKNANMVDPLTPETAPAIFIFEFSSTLDFVLAGLLPDQCRQYRMKVERLQ
jgi:hypothetical protein